MIRSLLCCFLLLAACQNPLSSVQEQGLENRLVQGDLFRHRILLNRPAQEARRQSAPVRWHLYIEGDGRPVDAAGRPSLDPTPRAPLLLPLMARDPAPALYLGRPCYFDTNDPACNPVRWTLERYSEATVASLAAALAPLIRPRDELVLIGHSGGGTLATLLAARLPQTRTLVTLAGNLDVDAWTRFHHYTPLPDSLDPARQPPLPGHIVQWHLAGAHDPLIPPDWIEAFCQRQPGTHFLRVEQASHEQGWADWFPAWLQQTGDAR